MSWYILGWLWPRVWRCVCLTMSSVIFMPVLSGFSGLATVVVVSFMKYVWAILHSVR